MRKYCSSENYLSIDEMEKISACRSLKFVIYPNLYDKTYVVHAYLNDVFLGTTRKLYKVPISSKFPRMNKIVISNCVIRENFA